MGGSLDDVADALPVPDHRGHRAVRSLAASTLLARAASRKIDPPPSYLSATPEEVLRQRFARGELTRDQYQESIIELLKGRYVTGELTLEDYETRVGTLIGDSPQRRLEGQAPKSYI